MKTNKPLYDIIIKRKEPMTGQVPDILRKYNPMVKGIE